MSAAAPTPAGRRAMSESAASLRDRARQCRQTALEATLENVAAALNEIALDYDRQADRVERAEAAARERLNGSRRD